MADWNVEKFWRYRNFILSLREALQTSRESFGVPHLTPQGSTPTFFDFILRTNNHHVTFRLQRDNLYLVGYRMENGEWLEFGRDGHAHAIPGANFLGFGGSYHDMARAVGLDSPEGIQVTSSTLETAVSDLATSVDHRTRAQRLIVVIMMICEAVRLNPILKEIEALYERREVLNPQKAEDSIKGWMMDVVRNWGNYSEVLCRCDADPTHFSFRESELRVPSEYVPSEYSPVSTVSQLVPILGITLSFCYAPSVA